MKKTLAILLALTMLLSVSAFASAEELLEVKVPSTLREGASIPAYITLPAEISDPCGLVVMIHGHGGNHNEWGGYDVISNGIAENGKIVVTLDFPGCGASEESFQLNTMTNMKQDVLDVINYMKANYPIGTVGGFGYSMGGRIILEMIEEDMFTFDSVEFVAPAEDSEDLKALFGGAEAWDEMSKKAHEDGYVEFTTVYGQHQELSAEWFDDLAKYADGLAESAAAKYDGPSIVIYATDDEAVSPSVSQGVADAFACPVFNTYTAGHSYSFYSDDPVVCATVNNNSIAFFTNPEAFLMPSSEEGYAPAPPQIKKDAAVVSVFAAAEVFPLNGPADREPIMLDAILIYYSDNTFDQYVQSRGGFELFTTGTYSFKDDGDFILNENETDAILLETRELFSLAEGKLVENASTAEYDLGTIRIDQLFGPTDGREVEAIFADDYSLNYADEDGVISKLDAIWIYFTDGTFAEYAYLNGEVVLFGSGSYELSETGDFHILPDEDDYGTITQTWEASLSEFSGETLTFNLGATGRTCLYEKYDASMMPKLPEKAA